MALGGVAFMPRSPCPRRDSGVDCMRMMPVSDIYVNPPEDGAIYTNEDIELQPTVVVAADNGEVQEEYENFDEIGRTSSQRSPSNDDEQQIYENVRKPKPAPKPKRTF